MNICVQVFVWTCVFYSLGYIPRNGIAGLHGNSMFKFLRNCQTVFILFYYYYYLFIYFWLHWVFVAACGLSLVVASGGYSSLWCVGFSLWWLLLLQSTGSRCAGFSSVARGLSSCALRALERRLSSCGAQT